MTGAGSAQSYASKVRNRTAVHHAPVGLGVTEGNQRLAMTYASRFGENFFGSAVLDENGFGSGGPCERFRILVSMLNPFVDCGFEFRDVVENASPYTLSGDFGEEPLDEVDPGAGRRRKVQDEAFVSCQPALHGRCLVSGVVVEDQMQIEMGGGLAINFLEEGQELVCPMAGQTFADDFAGRDVICGRPPMASVFWRFERFGRLRSYVRPVCAEHISAGLDEVRLPGSLSSARALRS